MEKMKKLISTLLTVCMLLGALTGLFTFEVFAANEDEDEIDWSSVDFTTEAYYTAEEKLATMELRFEKGEYQLWVHKYTGEVAVVNTATGEKLFSNPYDVGLSKSTASVKAEPSRRLKAAAMAERSLLLIPHSSSTATPAEV